MFASTRSRHHQGGATIVGMLTWAVLLGAAALLVMKVFPSVNEYWTIQKAVNKLAQEGGSSVQEVVAAFERQKQIEYSIQSISGKDLVITKENDEMVISFAYDKEIELIAPVFLLIKYEGHSTRR